jgi:hypothetical protein
MDILFHQDIRRARFKTAVNISKKQQISGILKEYFNIGQDWKLDFG